MNASATPAPAAIVTAQDVVPGASIQMWKGDTVIVKSVSDDIVRYTRRTLECESGLSLFVTCAKAVVR